MAVVGYPVSPHGGCIINTRTSQTRKNAICSSVRFEIKPQGTVPPPHNAITDAYSSVISIRVARVFTLQRVFCATACLGQSGRGGAVFLLWSVYRDWAISESGDLQVTHARSSCGGSLPSTVCRSIGAISMEVVTKCQIMYSSNGVPVPSLSVERTEAIQDRRLGLIQVTIIAGPLTAER